MNLRTLASKFYRCGLMDQVGNLRIASLQLQFLDSKKTVLTVLKFLCIFQWDETCRWDWRYNEMNCNSKYHSTKMINNKCLSFYQAVKNEGKVNVYFVSAYKTREMFNNTQLGDTVNNATEKLCIFFSHCLKHVAGCIQMLPHSHIQLPFI